MQALLRFATFLLAASLAFAGSPKISKDLEGVDPGATLDLIVQFSSGATAANKKKIRNHGGKARRDLESVKGFEASLPGSELEALAADDEVSYISADRPVKAALDYAVPTLAADIALDYGWDGEGVGIAIIDSGMYSHEDLYVPDDQVVYGKSFIDKKRTDPYGHGTHVAGIVAGTGSASSTAS